MLNKAVLPKNPVLRSCYEITSANIKAATQLNAGATNLSKFDGASKLAILKFASPTNPIHGLTNLDRFNVGEGHLPHRPLPKDAKSVAKR